MPPERGEGSGLGATLKLTAPFPVPDAPVVIVSQLASTRAVQLQWLAAATVTVPGPPADPNNNDVSDKVYVHTGVGVTGFVESHAARRAQIPPNTINDRHRIPSLLFVRRRSVQGEYPTGAGT
jgi:hypothetical protein